MRALGPGASASGGNEPVRLGWSTARDYLFGNDYERRPPDRGRKVPAVRGQSADVWLVPPACRGENLLLGRGQGSPEPLFGARAAAPGSSARARDPRWDRAPYPPVPDAKCRDSRPLPFRAGRRFFASPAFPHGPPLALGAARLKRRPAQLGTPGARGVTLYPPPSLESHQSAAREYSLKPGPACPKPRLRPPAYAARRPACRQVASTQQIARQHTHARLSLIYFKTKARTGPGPPRPQVTRFPVFVRSNPVPTRRTGSSCFVKIFLS